MLSASAHCNLLCQCKLCSDLMAVQLQQSIMFKIWLFLSIVLTNPAAGPGLISYLRLFLNALLQWWIAPSTLKETGPHKRSAKSLPGPRFQKLFASSSGLRIFAQWR